MDFINTYNMLSNLTDGALQEDTYHGDVKLVKLVNDLYYADKGFDLNSLKRFLCQQDKVVLGSSMYNGKLLSEKEIKFIASFRNMAKVIAETDKAYLICLPVQWRDRQDRSKLGKETYISFWVPKIRCEIIE